MSSDILVDFWEWKRSDYRNDFCSGKYGWDEFNVKWDEVKNKIDEKPEKGTGYLTDFYYWKTQKETYKSIPRLTENYGGPSECFFKEYYDNIIYPKRKMKNLPY
jgi:hypothetical protein